jgi:hypothetical protein
MIRLLMPALILLLAQHAAAETAVVRGGEHPDFTRIVIDAAQAGDWRLGRTDDGYALRLGPGVTGFDLTQAFERIPRDRVSALWRDPVGGELRFSLSCPCFAVAFEFRPGVLVIDIKTGQPPANSAFEEPLSPLHAPGAGAEAGLAEAPVEAGAPPDGDPMVDRLAPGPETAAESLPDPLAPGYDWLAITLDPGEGGTADPLPLPFAVEDPRLDPLRAALLAQISRGVAEGLVEMAEHPHLPDPSLGHDGETAGMRIATGELPGIAASGVHDPGPNLTPQGGPCLGDADLAIASWMLPGPIAEQLGPGRAGLLGEFDTPEPQAILRAARLYLALGFGAEARQFLAMLPEGQAQDAQLLRAMSHVVDQEPGGEPALSAMAGCDTAAALWAALTLTAAGEWQPSDVKALNAKAVGRSFSALPLHLRRYLGPPLVDLFLSAGLEEPARMIRDATLRAPGEAGPDVALMEAQYDLASGHGSKAAEIAHEVAKAAGPQSPEALATLVEAAFRSGAALPEGVAETLRAFQADARGTADEGPLHRAYLLATALEGDFAAAFAELPAAPDSAADLWGLAAAQSDDGLFLAEAVAAAAHGIPAVAPDTGLAVAGRLLDLGFPEQALGWLGPVAATDAPPRRLLAARAALALRDARRAGQLVAGMDDPEAQHIRAAAVLQLGDAAAAAEALDRAGDAAGRDRALTWTQDWPLLAETGADPWKSAAALTVAAAEAAGSAEDPALPPGQAGATGPLARSTALVAESAAARAAVEALLASVDASAAP